MQVSAIDHVNINTADLDGTAAFYERLLGLRRGESPVTAFGRTGAWMFDAAGNAIVHLVGTDTPEDGPTGAIDHVALRCAGFEAALSRITEMGLEYRVNDRKFGTFRQVFVTDPNGVKLELNFSGD